ncbi:MAG: ATP-binding cassette domain-containing protein [Burkholderiales bacterium]|jgi:lipooligosaccharide transport system ATP-binding protein|nr:ATP-binding cassette domain-containing protein [Burkholderiales bacterium]
MKPVLAVHGLVKTFGSHRAVDGVTFEVAPGECFGLLGPNGAGKSTTLKLALGLMEPDAGRIDLLGEPVPARAREARQKVGVVPQNDPLDPDFTVAENLLVFGRYFGQPDAITRSRIEPLLEFAQLGNKRDARIQTLSGGMKRRLTMARALINDPQVLFLDEPTTGLDPQARHLIWERLKRLLAQGKTIVLTTHFMDEAERLCDRLAIIDSGRPIASASPTALISQEIEPHVIEVHGPGRAHWADLAPRFGCGRVETVGETTFAYCEDPSAALAVLQTRSDVRTLHRPANLEDVFLKLTGRDLRD